MGIWFRFLFVCIWEFEFWKFLGRDDGWDVQWRAVKQLSTLLKVEKRTAAPAMVARRFPILSQLPPPTNTAWALAAHRRRVQSLSFDTRLWYFRFSQLALKKLLFLYFNFIYEYIVAFDSYKKSLYLVNYALLKLGELIIEMLIYLCNFLWVVIRILLSSQ